MAIIRFPIEPQTHVRSTQGDAVLFRIPEQCPHHCGLPRRSNKQPFVDEIVRKVGKGGLVKESVKKVRYGCPHMLSQSGLVRKMRLEKYNDYKLALYDMAKELHFTIPASGFAVYFFIPMTYEMLRLDKQRRAMDNALHMKRPDLDNFLKGFFDSLLANDHYIAHLAGLGKYWTSGAGYIEVHTDLPVYDPRAEAEAKPLVFKRVNKPMKDEDVLCPPMTINYSPTAASYDGEKLDDLFKQDRDNMFKRRSKELFSDTDSSPISQEDTDIFKAVRDDLKSGRSVDVNDKQAMEKVLEGAKKRKKKK